MNQHRRDDQGTAGRSGGEDPLGAVEAMVVRSGLLRSRLARRVATGLVAALLAALGFNATADRSEAPEPAESAVITDTGESVRYSSLPTISLGELPPEAVETLHLIESDGPFPYDRDGLVFQNREGLLPQRQRGHYQEYTVPTPGASDRGARRIVGGSDGERYYTADHYRSFHEIVEQ